MYKRSKRLFDIVFSILVLIAISPLMLLTAIAIKLESSGPIVYRSKRVGQNYNVFDLFKFRTMYVNADENIDVLKNLNQYKNPIFKTNDLIDCQFCKMLTYPCSPILVSDEDEVCEVLHFMRKSNEEKIAFYKINNDPRVTRIGKFLRRSSIDELPQLINVIKGEMSLIGNRPLPIYEAEKLTTDYAIARFNAPSGLTGLWQVSKRGKSEVSQRERIDLDIAYSQKWSLKMDMKILCKTIPALLQEENV